MSAFTCEIIGTGDGKLEKLEKNDSPPSTSMVKGIVEDMVENVLDILEDSCVAPQREKSPCFFGTGDQKSDEDIEKKLSCYFPRVEKKTRLTDLVRNSKQILQKMMLSESKTTLQEQERKSEEEQEKLIQAIDLDCVQLSDVQSPITPEDVPLPRNDSADILCPFDSISNESVTETSKNLEQSDTEQKSSDMIEIQLNYPVTEIAAPDFALNETNKNIEESDTESITGNDLLVTDMIEVGLNNSQASKESQASKKMDTIEVGSDPISKDPEQPDSSTTSMAKKLLTLPRATTSKAKAVFTAKCRTLKKEATILKKKKWNVSSRIANFFRKRRSTTKKDLEDDEVKKET